MSIIKCNIYILFSFNQIYWFWLIEVENIASCIEGSEETVVIDVMINMTSFHLSSCNLILV
jgi:hypothetical protein